MGFYYKDGDRTLEITAEERLKVLLLNAVGMYAEAHSDRYNSSREFCESVYDGLGTNEMEIKELGIDLSGIL